MKAQAEANAEKVKSFLDLHETKKTKIAEVTHSHHAIKTIDFIFKNPIFQVTKFVSQAGIPKPTAKRIVRILREKDIVGVLREASGRRPALLVFRKLLNITEGSEVF